MNKYLILDAISYLDVELLANHLEKKEKLRSRSKNMIKANLARWSVVAACIVLILCAVPVIHLIFDGSHSGAPISIEYANISEVHNQLGVDTLYAGLDFNSATTRSISVSYQGDEEGNALISKPLQLLIRQTYDNGGNVVNANFYVLFNKDDVKDSYISGYEEQGFSKEINGVIVHYSNIFDGANHTQAKFIYEGNLYVIDLVSSDEIDLDYILYKVFA